LPPSQFLAKSFKHAENRDPAVWDRNNQSHLEPSVLSKKARAAAQFQINANLPRRAKVAKLQLIFSYFFGFTSFASMCKQRKSSGHWNTKLLPNAQCMQEIQKHDPKKRDSKNKNHSTSKLRQQELHLLSFTI